MKKIRIGTVFSGIGAIEHALERLNVPHEIVFAADNGEINIYDLKIQKHHLILKEKLQETLNLNATDTLKIIEYSELERLLLEFKRLTRKKYKAVWEAIRYFLEENEDYPKSLTYSKENQEKTELYDYETVRDIVSYVVKHSKKHNKTKKMISEEWNKLRKERVVFDLQHQYVALQNYLNQKNEALTKEKIKEELSQLDSYEDRKTFIDQLYKETKKKNYVQETYLKNYEIDKNHYYQDVTYLEGERYKNEIDLFVGGSPCQSFSSIGKQLGLNDTRGTLFYEYARLVDEIQPKVFIYENVRNLIHHDKGRTWEVIQSVFNELNYEIHYQVLNAKDYGIPQSRNRIFVVGFRKDIELDREFNFPKPVELKLTMQDFLEDNISGRYFLSEKGVKHVTDQNRLKKGYTQVGGEVMLCQTKNQQSNLAGDFVFVQEQQHPNITDYLDKYFLSPKISEYVMSDGSKYYHSKPTIDTPIAKTILASSHKMHRASQDNYVTTKGRIRRLTPNECLRLMGFCSSFKIPVSDTQAYRQAGNSIVVDVLMAIYCEIEKTGVFKK